MALSSISFDNCAMEDNIYHQNLPVITDLIRKILDAFPQPAALLDMEEKVIAVNVNFLKLFSCTNEKLLIGKKHVEFFNCISAVDSISDSQHADQCRKCGAYLSLKGSNVTSQKFTERCILTYINEAGQIDDIHNLKVTTTPFTVENENFYLFSITDVSNDIRRRLLEKIFFHDVLNKAGNIIGILDVLNLVGDDDEKSDDLYESLKNTSHDLINEIKYQRDISFAENSELTRVIMPANSMEILFTTRDEIINSDVAINREILISPLSLNLKIFTDPVLLRRVLLNMLKNALEATKSGEKVMLGCDQENQESIRFWVHNKASIPEDIQNRLFNKPTTTKGLDRGLGTFSMKLIGEKYLQGKVGFISSDEFGTYFMIDLPLSIK